MWKLVESSNEIKPASVDTRSSKYAVFVRKDFEKIPVLDDGGKEIGTRWRYLEQAIPAEDWELYENQLTARADIDYCLMLLGEE